MSAALSARRFVARHFLRSTSGIISSSLSSLSSLSSSSLSRFSTSGSFPSSTSSSSSSSESSSSSSSPEEDDKNNNNNNNKDDDKEKNVTDKTLLSSFFALVHKKHPKDVPNDNLEKLQKHFPSLGMTEFQSKMNGQFGKKIGMSVKERKRIMQYLNKFKNGLFKI
jgi:hypothetical protein